jgi:hypothetical protein
MFLPLPSDYPTPARMAAADAWDAAKRHLDQTLYEERTGQVYEARRAMRDVNHQGTASAPSIDASGVQWRVVWVLEKGGRYRELYSMEAAQLGDLKGTVPDNVLESARGALKAKYQNASPPEADRALRAVLGRKYVARTVTGTFNPGSTSSAINAIGTAAKYAGRVMLVVVTYQEYHKIVAADDWTRQLGSSSSGILGAIGGGWAGGQGDCTISHVPSRTFSR